MCGHRRRGESVCHADRSIRQGRLRDDCGQDKKAAVLRGGSWNNEARNLRCANRNRNNPDNRNDNSGFRLVLSHVHILRKCGPTIWTLCRRGSLRRCLVRSAPCLARPGIYQKRLPPGVSLGQPIFSHRCESIMTRF
ncbi:hypothetical protein EH222_00285 [candidate division KSB1 bacterium]|nr:MAG: hypothetical protein EH222_00285 [candidate division KSB1 bacterium]